MADGGNTTNSLRVQVCYALPEVLILIDATVTPGATIEQAIRQSGILEKAPEISLARNKVGIYGKIKPLDTILREGDRVEIYRPLAVDPKEARRLRAQRQAGS